MSSSSKMPSKGPPPLPTYELPDAPFAAPLGDVADDVADVEEAFFLEGIDGHADSVPNEPEAVTIALAPIGGRPVELEEQAEQDADDEDPARARRRQLARIGVAWGAALMLGVASAGAFLSPHGPARSPVALSTSPAPVEARASAPVTAPIAATPPVHPSEEVGEQVSELAPAAAPAAAVTPPRSPVRSTTASTKAVGAAHPRAAAHKKGAAPSRGAKAPPASRKASSTRASQTGKPASRATASKPPTRGQSAKATS